MKQFNKYEFLKELRQDLISECANLYSRDADENEFQDSLDSFVHGYIDNACITMPIVGLYAMNCNNDFEIDQTGETAKNIQELAYWSLYDLSYSIDIDLLIRISETSNTKH